MGIPWGLSFFYTQYYINKNHPYHRVWLWFTQISLLRNISFCQGTPMYLSILLLRGSSGSVHHLFTAVLTIHAYVSWSTCARHAPGYLPKRETAGF